MNTARVGIVGLGIMGAEIARHLLAGGVGVMGYDPDATRLAQLVALGGTALDSAAAVARQSSIVFASLPSAQALDTTVTALVTAAKAGQIVVETSTLSLAAKQAAYEALTAVGCTLLDCPLSGTGSQARNKDLVVFASGDQSAYDRVRPLLAVFSRAQVYLGRFGSASTMKFLANHLVAIHNAAAAEMMALAGAAGLDLSLVLRTLEDSAGTSRMLQVRGPAMVRGDYSAPTTRIDTFMKDLGIIGNFAAELRCPTPVFDAATKLYGEAMAQGLHASDTAAICSVLQALAAAQARPA